MPIRPPVSTLSRRDFAAFQGRRTQTYARRQQNRVHAQGIQQVARQGQNLIDEGFTRGLGRQEGFRIGDVPILGGLLTGAGTFLSGAMDALVRPSQAIAGAVLGGQGDPRAGGGRGGLGGMIGGAATGLFGSREEREDFNWATILENAGVEHTGVRNTIGFALSAIIDPLNAIPLFGPAQAATKAAWRGTSALLQRAPITGRLIDAFAPHVGKIPATVLRREMGDETANALIEEARKLRSLSAGAAVRGAAREAFHAIGDVPIADRRRALELMWQHHGTPWANASAMSRTSGQRRVIDYFRTRFDSEVGDIGQIASQILDVNTVEGVYGRRLFLNPETRRMMDRTTTALRRQDARTTKRLARERGVDIPSGFEQVDDPLLVAAYDIAETRLLAQRARILSDDALESFGFRKATDDMLPREGESLFRPNGDRVRTLFKEDEEGLLRGIKIKEETWVGPESATKALNSMVDPWHNMGLAQLVDSLHSLWKPTVTVPFPAFHVRNWISNTVLNAHAGLFNPAFYFRAARLQANQADEVVVQYSREAAERLGQTHFKMNTDDFIRRLEEREALNSGTVFFRTAIDTGENVFDKIRVRVFGQPASQELSGRAIAIEQVKHVMNDFAEPLARRNGIGGTPIPNPFRWGRTANEATDNNAKIAHVLWRLSQGETLDNAARLTREALPNYLEFASSATFRSVRTFVPFLSWLRFNAVKQMQLLVEQPFVAARIGQVASSLETADEKLRSDELSLPDWVMDRLNILMGKDEDGALRIIYGLGLPIEDLNFWFKSFHGDGKEPGFDGFTAAVGGQAQNMLNDMGPFPRILLEWATKHSLFTGEPIDDPDISNFYSRAWRWTEHVPGLRDWLELDKRVTRSGRELWTANPGKMYFLTSLVGRFGRTAERGIETIVERDGLMAVSLLSGVKVGRIFPRAPSAEPLSAQLATDPNLRLEYEEYNRIPVYPQFGNPEASRRADKALEDIHDRRRWLMSYLPDISRQQALDVALKDYAGGDDEGALFARQVLENGWRQTGGPDRQRYLDEHPLLRAAFNRLTPTTQRRLVARALEEQ